MKYILASAVALTMMIGPMAGPAQAQFSGGGKEKTPLDLKYEREARDKEQIEKDYNRTMKRLKEQDAAKTNSDPWKNVRSSTDGSVKR